MNTIQECIGQTSRIATFKIVLPFDKSILKELPIRFVDSVDKLISFSNENFCLNQKYVLRVPTKDSNQVCNRQNEYLNIQHALEHGLSPLEVIYYNTTSGVMLSNFLEKYKFLNSDDFRDESILSKAVTTLYRMHNGSVPFTNIYDPRNLFFYYKSLLDRECNSYYKDIQKTIAELNDDLLQFRFGKGDLKPCHNDPNPSNFTLDAEFNCQLIDWEYSGLCDPAWDLTFLSEILLLDNTENLFSVYGSVSQEFRVRCDFFKPLVHARSVLFACEQLQSENPKLPRDLLLEIYRVRSESLIKTYQSLHFMEAKLKLCEANE